MTQEGCKGITLLMKTLLKCLPLLALLWSAVPAQSTVMVPLSVEELASKAELILRGTVVSKSCLKDPEGRIYTRIEFAVSEVWKGTLATNRFCIVRSGGTVGDETTVVDGEADYEPGEELVAFLRLNKRGEGVSIGLAQGKFKVWKDDDTGQPYAHNLFHGTPKVNAKPAAPQAHAQNLLVLGTPETPKALGLTELRARAVGGAK